MNLAFRDVASPLSQLQQGALVGVELPGHRPDQALAADLDHAESAAQRLELPNGPQDVVLADRLRPGSSPPLQPNSRSMAGPQKPFRC